MVLFDNPFYSDEDCSMVKNTSGGWKIERFERERLNRSKAHRTPFQRDLDNLTFCGAFRRLQGKTQVRKTGPKCFSRTRLSHSIEIARIARAIVSRLHMLKNAQLGQFIDTDLVEFACFAHDIGNPPFGHAGERELNRQMRERGGFEGNAQSLRIVTDTAWATRGIKPTRATVDSILKYKAVWSEKEEAPESRSKFLYDYQKQLLTQVGLESGRSIECQIMDLADDIGNALIDFSDGERAGIITKENVRDWLNRQSDNKGKFAAENVLKALDDNIMPMFSSVRVRDCIESLTISPDSATATRYGYVIRLTTKYQNFIDSLKRMNAEFLFNHHEIRANDNQGAFILRTLFEIFSTHYVAENSNTLVRNALIPVDWHSRLQEADESMKFRLICDYLSGMTDDYAKMTFDRAIEAAL